MHTILLFLFDFLAVTISLFLSLYIRFGSVYLSFPTLALLSILTIGAFYIDGLYDYKLYANKTRMFFRILRGLFLVFMVYLLIDFLIKDSPFIESRFIIVLSFVFIAILVPSFRFVLVAKILKTYYQNPQTKRDIYFIGRKERFNSVRKFFDEKPELGFSLSTEKPDSILLLWSDLLSYQSLYEEIVSYPVESPIYVASPLFLDLVPGWEWCNIEGVPVVEFQRKETRTKRVLKRLIDIVGAAVFITALSPLLLFISIAVKIDSRGQILFGQVRTGGGKKFVMLKFRTMKNGREEEREEKYREFINGNSNEGKILKEERVTVVGRFLRKSSLDELPQLFNVLKGDMSLVGPRPPIPYEVKHYKGWHKERLSMRPGMTGLWQIYGRGRLGFDASTFLDIIYMLNRSTLMDIKILFLTVPAIIFGTGAK